MEPLSEKRYLELHAPAGGDFLAARERLLAALPDGCRLTLGCLQQLYPVLSAADYRVTVTLCPEPGGTDAVRVEPGDTTAEHYGLCLDIGSTIMQMELVDLVRGRTLSQAACTNSQTQFGANILDRILAVKADRENLKTLQALTLSDVRGMIDTCCRAADIRPEAISAMTVGGNTTMLHFFLGCDPWLVFQSPYTPVFFDPGVIRAAELGLPICGNVYCMPAIANYLGGDITGGLLETDLDTREDLALFLDIGTNGELVLGCRDFLLMGAGAAGPALEGAVSHSGMRAEPGAICSVKIGADNRLRYRTIGDLPPMVSAAPAFWTSSPRAFSRAGSTRPGGCRRTLRPASARSGRRTASATSPRSSTLTTATCRSILPRTTSASSSPARPPRTPWSQRCCRA